MIAGTWVRRSKQASTLRVAGDSIRRIFSPFRLQAPTPSRVNPMASFPKIRENLDLFSFEITTMHPANL